MVEKDTVIKENVKFSGVGNFKEAYNHAHDLLSEEDYSITENTYSEKVSGNGKDIDIVCEHIQYAHSLGLKTNSDLLYSNTSKTRIQKHTKQTTTFTALCAHLC